jgi:hypothetical protein
VLEDPVIADSIVDRLKHIAISVTLTGESYRKVQGAALDKKPKNYWRYAPIVDKFASFRS